MYIRCALFGLLILIATASWAQIDTVGTAGFYTERAMEAYQKGDYQSFLENSQQAYRLRPDLPGVRYNLACGYSLTGNKEEALKYLKMLAEAGTDLGIAQDPDFAPLRDTEAYKNIVALLQAQGQPISRSTIAFMIPEKDLMPEGIAIDSATGTVYVGSVYKRKIMQYDQNGRLAEFVSPAADSLPGVLGMKVDPVRRTLWVCAGSFVNVRGYQPSDRNLTGVFRYDLTSGRLLKKYFLPRTRARQVLNDLVLNRAGDVFLTDSDNGTIYVITHDKDSLEILIPAGKILGSNGIAFSDDEKTLYVAGYSDQIYLVDPETGEYRPLLHPDSVCLFGIDGLYFYKNSLIGIQNGIRPHRIIQLHLSSGGDRVEGMEIIERKNPYFDEPTTGTILNDTLYYIANSQLSRYYHDGSPFGPDSLKEITILKAPLLR